MLVFSQVINRRVSRRNKAAQEQADRSDTQAAAKAYAQQLEASLRG